MFDGKKEYAFRSFEGLTPGSFDIEGDLVAISFPTNVIGSESMLKVFDAEANELYSAEIGEKIGFVETDGEEAVYTVGDSVAVKLSLADGALTYEEIRQQPVGAIAVPGSLIVCSPDGTSSYFTGAEE